MGLKVLIVSAEVAPFAKVGGLADVAASLPRALHAMGHDVRIVMPDYPLVTQNAADPIRIVVPDFRVSINSWWHKRATLKETHHHGVPVWLVGTDEWFCDVNDSSEIYSQNVDAYLFFARAVLASCIKTGWIPDVIHCNDWHTGFIPLLMRESDSEEWDHTGAIFTIHNLAYQGEFNIDVLDKVGVSRELFNHHQTEAYGSVNFLKTGAVMSDKVNTVSERYAVEIQSEKFGCRLDGFMKHLATIGNLTGILNGIDTDEWNPATDLQIAANFDAHHLAGKTKCREALCKEVGLSPIPGVPIAGMVSRLSEQKGMDLVVAAADQIVELGIQVIVQGLGDPWLSDQFERLSRQYPETFRFAPRFDIQLAQHIYSGADLFLMPSAFEPCGLGQLIAMRYGTLPLVRSTGGLADTVEDGDTGFAFSELNSEGFMSAMRRAKDAYAKPDKWARLMHTAMTRDYSWSTSAAKYVALYEDSLLGRRGLATLAS